MFQSCAHLFLSSSLIYTIHPWKLHLSHRICHSFLKEGGGPGKTTLSLLKDVTIRLRREGVQGKRDNVTLYDVFFFEGAPKLTTKLVEMSACLLTDGSRHFYQGLHFMCR